MVQLSIFDVTDISNDPLFIQLESLESLDRDITINICLNDDTKINIFKNVFGFYQLESDEIEEVFRSIHDVYEFIRKLEVVEIV